MNHAKYSIHCAFPDTNKEQQQQQKSEDENTNKEEEQKEPQREERIHSSESSNISRIENKTDRASPG
jgi:hypothetical protein